MTTFFVGGCRAVFKATDGRLWELETAHLIYLEGAVLRV